MWRYGRGVEKWAKSGDLLVGGGVGIGNRNWEERKVEMVVSWGVDFAVSV